MANELTPATRVEKLLAEILGEDYAVIPVTRIEKFLSNILGAEYDLIPATRIEKFLAKIAEEGGGGGADPNTILSIQKSQDTSWKISSTTATDINPIPDGGEIIIDFYNIDTPINDYGNIIGIGSASSGLEQWTSTAHVNFYLSYVADTDDAALTIRSNGVSINVPNRFSPYVKHTIRITRDGIYFDGVFATDQTPTSLASYVNNDKGLVIGSIQGTKRYNGIVSVKVKKG
jgi:hypothetical protein